MLESHEQYLFAAVPLPNSVADALANTQREISLALKQQDRKHRLLPKRMFLVPMLDLQRAPLHSDEAVMLAIEKATRDCSPIQLTTTAMTCWPSAEDAEQIVMRLKDEGEQLKSLRAKVQTRIHRLGFESRGGDWQPIIPLIRLARSDNDEPIDITLPSCRSESWRPNDVHLLGRSKQEQRARFQILAKVSMAQDDAETSSSEPSETEIRAEIAEALTLRIEERRRRLSESKRSERAKAKREEEHSMEPQPIGDMADTDIDE